MFDFDIFREIGETVKTNKLRTLLTGLSVTWGIFMLIVLLGAGQGLKNGITSNFSGRAKNTISLGSGRVSMPYKGLPVDREVKFENKDFNLLQNEFPEIDYLSGQIRTSTTLSYGKEYGTWNLIGVHPDASYINNIEMSEGEGRFINEIDIDKQRKSIVINQEIKDVLFKDTDPLGKYVLANGIAYQVVGVYKDNSGRSNVPAYISFSTAQLLYRGGNSIDRFDFTVQGLTTLPDNEAFIVRLREKVGALHNFDPADKSAIWIWNTAEDSVQTESIFTGLNYFMWVVGIASLIAGIVGVGNIMLITVKERTREIGIRKAIGAKSSSVLRMILMESVMITTIFGYIGIVLGIGLVELINQALKNAGGGDGPTVFKDPGVDLNVVFFATLLLIIAGAIAGYIPAKRAVSVSPIEAMRAE